MIPSGIHIEYWMKLSNIYPKKKSVHTNDYLRFSLDFHIWQTKPFQLIESVASSTYPTRKTNERSRNKTAAVSGGGKWKTQLIFNLIKFNYCDACFLLLRPPLCAAITGEDGNGKRKKLMTRRTQFFHLSAEKRTEERRRNVITFSLECNANNCCYFHLPFFPLIAPTREWYNETFNFAYNLENGFSKQYFKFLLVVTVGRESDSWELCLVVRGGCIDMESSPSPARYWLMQIWRTSKITFAFATCYENIFAGGSLFSSWRLCDKKRNKGTQHDATSATITNLKSLDRRSDNTFGPSRKAKCPFDNGKKYKRWKRRNV